MLLNIVIVGNVLSLIGMSLFVLSSLPKTKNKILITQNFSHFFNACAEACTKQYAGVVQEFINFIRNLVVIKNKNNKYILILLIALGLIIGILVNVFFNNNDLIGYLPILSTFGYSIIVLIKDIKVLYIRLAVMVSSTCWAIYGFCYLNYVMMIFNIASFIITLIQVIILLFFTKKDIVS